MDGQREETRSCQYCDQVGHLVAHCKKKARDEKTDKKNEKFKDKKREKAKDKMREKAEDEQRLGRELEQTSPQGEAVSLCELIPEIWPDTDEET